MKPRRLLHAVIAAALLGLSGAGAAAAQVGERVVPADTLRLSELHAAALGQDPRAEQVDLVRAQSASRLRSIRSGRLPSLSLHAQGQYQSDVPTIPFQLPGDATPPLPPHDTYDLFLSVRQSLYDPSLPARRRVEVARGEEARAQVVSSLYDLWQKVNEAFFGALLLRIQASEVEAAMAAILAHLDVVSTRVAERAALPSEEAALRRELLREQQLLTELREREEAAREQLALLTGMDVGGATELRSPELAEMAAAVRRDLESLRSRPEYERFDRARELLQRQSEALSARRQPQLSAFGRGGYGRPGLNPLAADFDAYWLAGVQVEWTPWQRGTVELERRELALQREIVDTEEAAFARELERAMIAEIAQIEQLEEALVRDAEIIALSEEILMETRLRFAEAAVTSAELLEDEAELLRARLDRNAHSVGLARARARLITISGYELP